ncbi:penicillin-binding protein 1A [Aquabacterium sp. CECT 9606]|uniref:penicillin-binding protein 1A n=1 Tax=Aquabacterium sp. CECT 9606 TaxID=2845822 RepID=UPI001E5E0F68|nr:transglycosylase domain-containing protein [Aquabacterium sp. CECT 9606]CAH0351490.1 Penicillin-binding protein 1A [Aquabacterium sp. CECT 9606]
MNSPLRQTLIWLMLATTALAVAAAVFVGYQVTQAPAVTELKTTQVPQPSVILSADGKTIGRFQEQRLQPVTLAQVSPYVTQALIATEDHRFREHHGVDWLRSIKAIFRTATGRMEGGSTLTQQLVRNLFPEDIGRSRNLGRKVKEIVTALRIERIYTKDQILEAYLNTVPFLYNAVGIEAAAHTYFDKPAIELDAAESATLVGMLKGTNYYNPVLHPQRAKARRNLVLAQMLKRGVLSQADHDAARQEDLQVSLTHQAVDLDLAPHFAAQVRRWLDDWADQNDRDLSREGLIIHTTLDSRLQEAAVKAVERQTESLQHVADVEWSAAAMPVVSRSLDSYAQASKAKAFEHFWRQHPKLLAEAARRTPDYRKLVKSGQPPAQALKTVMGDAELMAKVRADKTRLEAGFVAMDPRSGAIKAWVGSRDFGDEQFDHVGQAARQPGSTFKPIVYAAALEAGILPTRTYVDTPIEVRLGNGKVWRPTDMSGSTGESMTMWQGLVLSKNTITTQVMQDAGLPRITALAKTMGITDSKLDPVPSMALGTSPVTLLEMATVYATIASGGEHKQPYFVERITDKQGKEVAVFGPNKVDRALSVDTVNNLIDMMRGVVTYGTGTMLRTRFVPEGDLAGKTGTTQNNTDGWFMVMHPQLVTGAWVGFNDQHVTMRGSYWGQGGHSALLLVGDFLRTAFKQKLMDVQASFPSPRRPPVTGNGEWSPTNDEVDESAPLLDSEGNPITADPAGEQPRNPAMDEGEADTDAPKTSDELDQLVNRLGRSSDNRPAISPPPFPERPQEPARP